MSRIVPEKLFLLGISELNIVNKLGKMRDQQVNEYWDKLRAFSSDYQELDEKIKAAIVEKDYESLNKHLSYLSDMLKDVYADKIADDCLIQTNELADPSFIKHEKLEAFVNYILTTASMLSIDIQMAEHKLFNAKDKTASEDDLSLNDNQNDSDANSPAAVKTVLAVDDSVVQLSLMRSYLKDSRFKLTALSSGKDALVYLQTNSPDIFILDILMPDIDGYELAKKIKDMNHTAPIIFLTGTASRESVAKAIQAGGTDFIIKPSTKEQVLGRLSKLA